MRRVLISATLFTLAALGLGLLSGCHDGYSSYSHRLSYSSPGCFDRPSAPRYSYRDYCPPPRRGWRY